MLHVHLLSHPNTFSRQRLSAITSIPVSPVTRTLRINPEPHAMQGFIAWSQGLTPFHIFV